MKKKRGILAAAIGVMALVFICGSTGIIRAEERQNTLSETGKAGYVYMTPPPSSAPVVTQAPTPTPKPRNYRMLKIGNDLREVYEIEGRFKKKNHRIVFVKDSGKVYKKHFFLRAGRIYFADKTGEIVHGWKKYKENIYFFSRKNGSLTDKSRVEGVKIGDYGIVKKKKNNQYRAETYLKVAAVLKRITKPTDSKDKKLYAAYQWVMSYGYCRHRTMKQMMQQQGWKKNWDLVFANDIFDKHSGCCVSYAASFALFAKECGYKKVTLCCDTGHAWDDIGGYLYDPLFAKGRSFSANYHAKYTDYRVNPAITKKIS